MLIKSALINPHGLGVTWLDTYETEYSLSSDWVLLAVERPYIAHFRYATIGGVSLANNHPFEIGDTKCMLYQNGSVYNLGDMEETDTEHMARILAATHSKFWGDILEQTDCRWVVVDPEFKCYDMYNEEMFIEKGEVQWSKDNVLETELVAVYGTLKRGFGNNSVMGMSKYVDSGKTMNTYDMVDVGIPYVSQQKGGANNIVVEVFLVSPTQLPSIDALEGHPSHYRRSRTPIELSDGTVVMAWMYFLPDFSRFVGEPRIAEYTRGYQEYQYNNLLYTPAEDLGTEWHWDDAKETWETKDADGAACDKCSGTNTNWDDWADNLYCFACGDYTTSAEIVTIADNDDAQFAQAYQDEVKLM